MGKKRRSDERRPEEPRTFVRPKTIDLADPGVVERWARDFGTTPEEIAAAVRRVGPNATAVEMYLSAPEP